jgi:endonuclease/exonuclease/phosphatase family metal-dependent hydrolase
MSTPPANVAQELTAMRSAAHGVVPAKTPDNLLIATWNLRAFGGLTKSWQARASDSPKRDWRAVALIAGVIGCFDVVAVQEVKRDVTALRFLLDCLGPRWKMIVTDVTKGEAGNGERLTFLYDSERVQPSGLMSEMVLPPIAGDPARQFARTPYSASFTRGGTEFTLTTVHVLWGDKPADRVSEVAAFAQWMRAWADRKNDLNKNLLVLGDFNLDRLGNPLYGAFVSTGLWPPSVLNDVPRTIFDNDRDRHFYDQIAWFGDTTGSGGQGLLDGLAFTGQGGTFNFLPHVFAGMTKNQVSWRISDHYPLWVEFTLA